MESPLFTEFTFSLFKPLYLLKLYNCSVIYLTTSNDKCQKIVPQIVNGYTNRVITHVSIKCFYFEFFYAILTFPFQYNKLRKFPFPAVVFFKYFSRVFSYHLLSNQLSSYSHILNQNEIRWFVHPKFRSANKCWVWAYWLCWVIQAIWQFFSQTSVESLHWLAC